LSKFQIFGLCDYVDFENAIFKTHSFENMRTKRTYFQKNMVFQPPLTNQKIIFN